MVTTSLFYVPILSSLFFLNRLTGRLGVYLNLITYIYYSLMLIGLIYFNPAIQINFGQFINVGSVFWSEYSLTLDGLSLGLLIAIISISSLVQLYSTYYMEEDPSNIRFFTHINMFGLFMILLVLADNLLVLFLGKIIPA